MVNAFYLDTHPDAKYEPYICCSCMKNCGALVNDKYCIKCWNDMETAKAIFNSDKSPLDFLVESGGSVRFAPKNCERCGKKFRWYRKMNVVYDKTAHKYHAWKDICIDCINLETDVF